MSPKIDWTNGTVQVKVGVKNPPAEVTFGSIIVGVAALLLAGAPLGFVAILDILLRNSDILIVQMETLREEGFEALAAVVKATEHRMLPILLTAAVASLSLIPISRGIFWGQWHLR